MSKITSLEWCDDCGYVPDKKGNCACNVKNIIIPCPHYYRLIFDKDGCPKRITSRDEPYCNLKCHFYSEGNNHDGSHFVKCNIGASEPIEDTDFAMKPTDRCPGMGTYRLEKIADQEVDSLGDPDTNKPSVTEITIIKKGGE